jgi:ABC-type multidrug transport system fused ATPase/permease subunit
VSGFAVAELDHAWLHQVIAMVGQEPVLFAGTIESNILYGLCADSETVHASSPGVAAERDRSGAFFGSLRQRVIEAATIANAHGFVSALPDGYSTSVGERGVQLSGGQRQRIAIARAIVRNPKVLLLDEATSALDSDSEALVQSALERAMEGRTVVVVAHRLSTVARADRIAFLHQGRLLECGSHQELMHR